MVDYIREMTVKKSFKYGEYGSFEHLLFLLLYVTTDCLGSSSSDTRGVVSAALSGSRLAVGPNFSVDQSCILSRSMPFNDVNLSTHPYY